MTTDPILDFANPRRMGKALADETLAGYLEDLDDASRDTVREHFDLNNGHTTVFEDALTAYRERVEVLLARLPENDTLFAD